MCLVGKSLAMNEYTLAVILADVPDFSTIIFTPAEERYEKRCVQILERYIHCRGDGLSPAERNEASFNRTYVQAYRAHHQFLYLLSPVWICIVTSGRVDESRFSEKLIMDSTRMLVDNSTSIEKFILQGSSVLQSLMQVCDEGLLDAIKHPPATYWIKYGAFPAFLMATVFSQAGESAILLTLVSAFPEAGLSAGRVHP